MNERITSILGQQGWQDIEEMFREEILESKKLMDIKEDTYTNEQLGEIFRARKEAAKIVDKAIKRIYREGSLTQLKKESYK